MGASVNVRLLAFKREKSSPSPFDFNLFDGRYRGRTVVLLMRGGRRESALFGRASIWGGGGERDLLSTTVRNVVCFSIKYTKKEAYYSKAFGFGWK